MFKGRRNLFISGGTFGHIYPALMMQTLFSGDLYLEEDSRRFMSEEINIQRNNLSRIRFFEGYKTYNIYKIFTRWIFFWKLFRNYDNIIIFGGFSGFWVIIPSIFSLRNFFFHEQNAVLGLVNRIACYFFFQPLLSFENTQKLPIFKRKPIVFGYPIESKIEKEIDGNDLKEKTLLVMPGSLGSSFFDDNIAEIIKNLDCKIYFVARNVEKVRKIFENRKQYTEVSSFFFSIDSLIQKCDLLLCRSGAGTIAKIFNYEKKAILIPLEHSSHDHQRINAEISGLNFLQEKDILKNPDIFRKTIEQVFQSNAKCDQDWNLKYKSSMKIVIIEKKSNL